MKKSLLIAVILLAGCNNAPKEEDSTVYDSIAREIVELHGLIPKKENNKRNLSREQSTVAAEQSAKDRSWIDDIDLDDLLNNKWLLAGLFLLIQWLEILYYSRTGKTSKTIDAAEASIGTSLGWMQRLIYWFWRKNYFNNHPDRADPDKKERNEK